MDFIKLLKSFAFPFVFSILAYRFALFIVIAEGVLFIISAISTLGKSNFTSIQIL